MKDSKLSELTSLFFTTRQIIKQQLPSGESDPNTWLRFETLRFIGESKDPTMQDLAHYLRVKAPSATSLVAHLAKTGLIARKGEKEDKRIVRISLTAVGKKEIKNYTARCAKTMQKVFSKLNDREVDELVTILRHLRDIHQSHIPQ
jgi:DNA-binding MarR family transcriptional regulator